MAEYQPWRYFAQRWITTRLLGLVWAINRTKDNGLAKELHALADLYDTRPTGQWR